MDSSSEGDSSGNYSGSDIETNTEKTYEIEDFMNVQLTFMDTLTEMAYKQSESNVRCVDLAEQLLIEQESIQNKFAEEFIDFIKHAEYRLCNAVLNVEKKADRFAEEIDALLDLYVDVNEMMKSGNKDAAEQDLFLAQAEKNMKQYKATKGNLDKLKKQMTILKPPVPSITSLSSSDVSKDFVKANTVVKPFKPLETEIVTHIIRIIKGIHEFHAHLEKHKKLKKYTEPIVKHSKFTAQKILKEFPARSLAEFINTLPPEHRD